MFKIISTRCEKIESRRIVGSPYCITNVQKTRSSVKWICEWGFPDFLNFFIC